MNRPKYVELLSDKLKLYMEVHNYNIFMQDKALCHCSKVAIKFPAQNKVKVPKWPGYSPELNPIKNLSTELKNKVSERQPSSVPELAGVIKEVWVREISKEYCQSLIKSVPRRMAAAIRNKGGHTEY